MRISADGRGSVFVAAALTVFLAVPGAGAEQKSSQGYAGFGADSVSEEILARFTPPPIDPGLRTRIERILSAHPISRANSR